MERRFATLKSALYRHSRYISWWMGGGKDRTTQVLLHNNYRVYIKGLELIKLGNMFLKVYVICFHSIRLSISVKEVTKEPLLRVVRSIMGETFGYA